MSLIKVAPVRMEGRVYRPEVTLVTENGRLRPLGVGAAPESDPGFRKPRLCGSGAGLFNFSTSNVGKYQLLAALCECSVFLGVFGGLNAHLAMFKFTATRLFARTPCFGFVS